MIKMGFPDEEIVHHKMIGDMLVAMTKEPTTVVTFIWGGTTLGNYNPRLLYTVLSTCYDGSLFDKFAKPFWLYEFLMTTNQVMPHVYFEKEVTDNLLSAQAIAFNQIKTLNKKLGYNTHDTERYTAPAS